MIGFGRQQCFNISESSEIAAARRAGNTLAQALGFDEVRAGQLALVITEVATNIVKHAGCGQLLLRSLECERTSGIEVLALDKGPGITNLELQMEDGYSTAGSYGVGLGAIKRQAQQFDVYTRQGQGTVLWMVVWADAQAPAAEPWEVGAICLPYPGEDVCGDDWVAVGDRSTMTFLIADGLGHGPDAAVASAAARRVVGRQPQQAPAELIGAAHTALRGTRGAALAIGQIHTQQRQLRFAGVGNIAASVHDAGAHRHLVSYNGIVGSNVRKVQEVSLPWQRGALLVAHSDGINTRWELDDYPGLSQCAPALIAAVLYRDFLRGRDDVTVLVLREHWSAS